MVNFKVPDVKRAMELGKEAAEYITKTFPPPVKLEFEKVRQGAFGIPSTAERFCLRMYKNAKHCCGMRRHVLA